MPHLVPPPHAAFLERAVPLLAGDARLVGVAIGGSYIDGSMDEWSDLDLVVAVEADAYDAVLVARPEIASRLGPLLSGFTGEHVGDSRLLICLYGPPLLHVDLKFVRLADLSSRVEDPAVLWERDGRMTAALRVGRAEFPQPDLAWIEPRFWVWVHYVANKVGRGELLEALGSLSFLREIVLGRLVLATRGHRPAGVRKLERLVPDILPRMRETVGDYDPISCLRALRATATLYRELRALYDGEAPRARAAEDAAMAHLAEIEAVCVRRLATPDAGPSGGR